VVKLSMKMIISESDCYQIRAADREKICVVNGVDFCYSNTLN
jgi:hypothetical protein